VHGASTAKKNPGSGMSAGSKPSKAPIYGSAAGAVGSKIWEKEACLGAGHPRACGRPGRLGAGRGAPHLRKKALRPARKKGTMLKGKVAAIRVQEERTKNSSQRSPENRDAGAEDLGGTLEKSRKNKLRGGYFRRDFRSPPLKLTGLANNLKKQDHRGDRQQPVAFLAPPFASKMGKSLLKKKKRPSFLFSRELTLCRMQPGRKMSQRVRQRKSMSGGDRVPRERLVRVESSPVAGEDPLRKRINPQRGQSSRKKRLQKYAGPNTTRGSSNL